MTVDEKSEPRTQHGTVSELDGSHCQTSFQTVRNSALGIPSHGLYRHIRIRKPHSELLLFCGENIYSNKSKDFRISLHFEVGRVRY